MTWEWLAGFFDGEGCICYSKRSYGRYAMLHITQCRKHEAECGIIHQIHAFLQQNGVVAGRLMEYDNASTGGWRINIQNAPGVIRMLEGMLPYLRVKREKAKEALLFAQATHKRKIDRRIAA